eukprot:TRINITY_DN71_c0_g2_i9.p1 TRINITY_DN71_c0_g2~~TRINITY_DN71_c0_g2_i9.p1  ORF type:complete len:1387 (-),score=345.61 TRINITY_DN71_c0_g2_i9:129-4289(-)
MGFTVEDKNYLLLTDGARGMSIQLLGPTSTTTVFEGQWEQDYVSYCMSHFAKKRYLIAGRVDGHSIILLTPGVGDRGYSIVYQTTEMDGRLAFEEYVRTLVGGNAQINFSKTSSAYSSRQDLKYPNGYIFSYLPDKPGEVSYDSPDTGRLWKLNWDEDYTHHVGFVFFGKNYLLSYKKVGGHFDTRLLSGMDVTKTGHGVFDPDWQTLRIAYFEDSPYLIAEAPEKQAIYELTANSHKKVHASQGADAHKSAEVVIKAVAAKRKVVRFTNGFTVDFSDGKASCNGPTGFLWEEPFDDVAYPKHIGLILNGEPLLLSFATNSVAFRIDKLKNEGSESLYGGNLDKHYANISSVTFEAQPFIVASSPTAQTIFSVGADALTPVHAVDKSVDPDFSFTNHVKANLSSPSAPFGFESLKEDTLPGGDRTFSFSLVYPQNRRAKIGQDNSISFQDTLKAPPANLWSEAFDVDVTHFVGFVANGHPHSLAYKHGQGVVQIKALADSKSTETLTAIIDTEWTFLSTIHRDDKSFLLAFKPNQKGVYLLTPNQIKLLHTEPLSDADKPVDFLIQDIANALAKFPPGANIPDEILCVPAELEEETTELLPPPGALKSGTAPTSQAGAPSPFGGKPGSGISRSAPLDSPTAAASQPGQGIGATFKLGQQASPYGVAPGAGAGPKAQPGTAATPYAATQPGAKSAPSGVVPGSGAGPSAQAGAGSEPYGVIPGNGTGPNAKPGSTPSPYGVAPGSGTGPNAKPGSTPSPYGVAPGSSTGPNAKPGSAASPYGVAPGSGTGPDAKPGSAASPYGVAPGSGTGPDAKPGSAASPYGVAPGSGTGPNAKPGSAASPYGVAPGSGLGPNVKPGSGASPYGVTPGSGTGPNAQSGAPASPYGVTPGSGVGPNAKQPATASPYGVAPGSGSGLNTQPGTGSSPLGVAPGAGVGPSSKPASSPSLYGVAPGSPSPKVGLAAGPQLQQGRPSQFGLDEGGNPLDDSEQSVNPDDVDKFPSGLGSGRAPISRSTGSPVGFGSLDDLSHLEDPTAVFPHLGSQPGVNPVTKPEAAGVSGVGGNGDVPHDHSSPSGHPAGSGVGTSPGSKPLGFGVGSAPVTDGNARGVGPNTKQPAATSPYGVAPGSGSGLGNRVSPAAGQPSAATGPGARPGTSPANFGVKGNGDTAQHSGAGVGLGQPVGFGVDANATPASHIDGALLPLLPGDAAAAASSGAGGSVHLGHGHAYDAACHNSGVVVGLSPTATASELCAQQIFFPGHKYFISIPCHGNYVTYNECYWSAPWNHAFSHCLGFSFEGANYLLSYVAATGFWTINLLLQDSVVETARGHWEAHWSTFTVSYYQNQVILVSTRADRQDVGLLTSAGYTFLQTRGGFNEFLQSAVAKLGH